MCHYFKATMENTHNYSSLHENYCLGLLGITLLHYFLFNENNKDAENSSAFDITSFIIGADILIQNVVSHIRSKDSLLFILKRKLSCNCNKKNYTIIIMHTWRTQVKPKRPAAKKNRKNKQK